MAKEKCIIFRLAINASFWLIFIIIVPTVLTMRLMIHTGYRINLKFEYLIILVKNFKVILGMQCRLNSRDFFYLGVFIVDVPCTTVVKLYFSFCHLNLNKE